MNDLSIVENRQVASADSVSTNIQVFNCELGQVRVVFKENEPLFCLSDIAKILDFRDGNNLKKQIEAEFEPYIFNMYPLKTETRGIQNFSFVGESELYFVLMRSRSDKAKPFRQWVVKDVLPSIRKNGGYIAGQENMTELEILANALIVANNVIQSKSKELETLKALRAKEKPLVDFANAVAKSSNGISVGDFAKLLNDENIKLGQNRLFQWFRDNKYLMRSNLPYQLYVDLGYFEIIEQVFKTPYGEKTSLKTIVTGKGQIYFTEILRKGVSHVE